MDFARPTLLLDKETCLRNIDRMVSKAQQANIRLRPHFKTHQSAQIGEWFRQAGITAITVSSVSMASFFAQHGWTDITIAFPVNILEIDQINVLASSVKLNLLVENRESLVYLDKFIKAPVGLFIKIDTGYNRTGILSSRTCQIDALLPFMKENSNLQFKGFLSHTGHTYQAKTKHDVYSRHFDALLKMRALKNHYRRDWPGLQISLGDTPSCSMCDNFDGIDEIRPGNFVFYDLMQLQLGSCSFEDIAVRLVCPIVAKHASRNEVVIYGGAVHISKDSITNIDGKQLFGRIVVNNEGEKILLDEKNYLHSMSQEHGILRVAYKDFNHFRVGNTVEIVPVHSCLTANLMGQYTTTGGEKIGMMPRNFTLIEP